MAPSAANVWTSRRQRTRVKPVTGRHQFHFPSPFHTPSVLSARPSIPSRPARRKSRRATGCFGTRSTHPQAIRRVLTLGSPTSSLCVSGLRLLLHTRTPCCHSRPSHPSARSHLLPIPHPQTQARSTEYSQSMWLICGVDDRPHVWPGRQGDWPSAGGMAAPPARSVSPRWHRNPPAAGLRCATTRGRPFGSFPLLLPATA